MVGKAFTGESLNFFPFFCERLPNFTFVAGIKFYDAMISSTLVDRIADVKKLNLLYKAKPFNYFSKSILKAIRSQPIEVPELILHLAKHDSLNIIPYLENKLICTKGETFQPFGTLQRSI